MTLYERVIRAGNAPVEVQETTAQLMDDLRSRLSEMISVDQLAKLAQTNPERARNEVRSACRRVFEDPSWGHAVAGLEQRLVSQLLDSIFGFGILENLIADEGITEIMVNGPQRIFIEREGVLYQVDSAFADEDELRALIDRILGPLGRRIDESSPMVNARLPQGHRVNVVVPPVGLDGPYVTIRKFSRHVMTLDEMQEKGTVDERLKTFLVWAVRARRSIAVSGGTGSGKTTLLNSLSCEIPPTERIVTIEDSAELRFFTHPNVVRLEARAKNAEGEGEVTIRDLVINALRMRPDRIIVGECRGAEALDMLQAMNTGHAGSLTTLHANSPAESISRLATMVRYESELPIDVVEANIATAIDLVVQTQRCLDGTRRVSQVVSFAFDLERRRCTTVPLYERDYGAEEGRWLSIPDWIDELCRQGNASEKEVEAWKSVCSSRC